MNDNAQLITLLRRSAGVLAAHESRIAGVLASGLIHAVHDMTEQAVVRGSASVPLCEKLPSAKGHDAESLLGSVLACSDRLHWRSRGAARRPAALAAHIASVELVGPTGMIERGDIRFGVFLQDRHLDYPWHRHAAEELYVVLHGEATWIREGSESQVVPPDSLVHHVPWQAHRMTSGDDVLLALWGWCGDVSYERYELLTSGED